MEYAIWNQLARTRLSTPFHKKKLKKFCSVTTSEQRYSNSRTSPLYLAPDNRPGNECGKLEARSSQADNDDNGCNDEHRKNCEGECIQGTKGDIHRSSRPHVIVWAPRIRW